MRVIIFIFALLWTVPSWAAVLFSDNFDSQADWNSSLGTVPTGWYDAGSIQNTISENTMQIKSGSGFAYGGSGKAYVHYHESLTEAACGASVWCSDGLLGASFTATQDIYIGFRFKLQSGWQWYTDCSDCYGAGFKILHVSHYGGGSLYTFHGETENVPRFVPVLNREGYSPTHYVRMYAVTHGGSGEEVYWNPGNGWTASEDGDAGNSTGCTAPCLADNTWHSVVYRIKNNTKTGSTYNNDGILQVWVNDTLEFQKTTIAWCTDTNTSGGDPANFGWNHAWVGGNNYNNYSNGSEQWYAVDNFVVATTKDEVDSFLSSGSAAVPTMSGVTAVGVRMQ